MVYLFVIDQHHIIFQRSVLQNNEGPYRQTDIVPIKEMFNNQNHPAALKRPRTKIIVELAALSFNAQGLRTILNAFQSLQKLRLNIAVPCQVP
jgi:hypothetical protein